MTKNLDNTGFRSIVQDYDFFFIDLWGVVHNGIRLYENAIRALIEINNVKKNYVLLTNAPRPNNTVKVFLEKMGMDKSIFEKVYTSGEAALNYLKKNHLNDKFYHIGPPRDFDLFLDFKENKKENINECNYFLCTGLFDKHDQDLNYYKELLNSFISKKMICTNPDLIVDRGEKREFCAGSVAKVFEELGGKVEYFGKPYSKVYNQATITKNKKVLCIGDNLNTDIKGANNQNFASLLISNGVHKEEIKNENFERIMKKYNTKVDYIQFKLQW